MTAPGRRPGPVFETVRDLEHAYGANRNPVNEWTPAVLILASTHGQGPNVWHDLFAEIRCLAQGAISLVCEGDGRALSDEDHWLVFTSAKLIATKAAGLVALMQRDHNDQAALRHEEHT